MNLAVAMTTAFRNMNDSLYQQETDIAVVLVLAQHCERRTFIDVGAEKGEFARKLIGLGWNGNLFEPFPNHLEALRELVEGSGSRVFDIALDETDHAGLLNIAIAADGTTMDYFHSLHRDESNPIARHQDTIAVPCRSLGSLAKEGLVDDKVGVLKIDTEGTDLKVILGMGAVTAEVLICEFVTPLLYPTWTNSFPEALVKAAKERGYEECIAVKRVGVYEMVTFGPPVFVDGQWGNLIFTSHALMALAREELHELALSAEKRHVAALASQQQSLEEKEAVIQALNQACVERQGVIDNLKTKKQELRAKVETLREKITQLRTKA